MGRATQTNAKIAGLSIIGVGVDDVHPNPWNPNVMDEATYEKEKRSIAEYGFIDPITVRETTEGYEIIDGEHRWKAARELGISELPATNLGRLPDEQAKMLTIIVNELRGAPDPAQLGKLLAELSASSTAEELTRDLPLNIAEIEALVSNVSDFAWDWGTSSEEPLSNNDNRDRGERLAGQAAVADGRRFMIGTIHGMVTSALIEGLVAEYERTSKDLEDKSPEIILRDWLSRLAYSEPGDGE